MLPGPFADQAAWLWRYTTAMYPPLSLEMFHGLVVLVGNNPYYSAMAMRIPALLGVALIAYFLPRLAVRMGADPQMTAWFSTINPLIIIDFVGGAHNDALMMGLVVLALWLALSQRFWWAAVLVGVAACIKQPAILAFYPVAADRAPLAHLPMAGLLARPGTAVAVPRCLGGHLRRDLARDRPGVRLDRSGGRARPRRARWPPSPSWAPG